MNFLSIFFLFLERLEDIKKFNKANEKIFIISRFVDHYTNNEKVL